MTARGEPASPSRLSISVSNPLGNHEGHGEHGGGAGRAPLRRRRGFCCRRGSDPAFPDGRHFDNPF